MTATAEEFGQLIGALREWASTHLATDEPQCQLCPLCQAIVALRESRPEVAEHLTIAAVSLVAAVKAFLEGVPMAPGRSGSSARSVVEHIDIA
ncbi:MAG TPA: hypothetical protein VKG85_03385 [Actinomycetes bacterium]|nr:hypothetical protein [Actinomycetes bacterium]